ncbi:MAG: SIS domain-containing protein [Planctomycetota bacterium]
MLGITHDNREYFALAAQQIQNIDCAALQRLSDAVMQRYDQGKFIYIIGNGGSGLNASHFAEDLGKSTVPDAHLQDPDRKRLKVLSLTDNLGWIMAAGNDVGYEHIFTQQLMNYGQAGDLLIAISGSGNSPNILHAVDWAKNHGLTTFGLTGYTGGTLKRQQDDGLHVECNDMGVVESLHLLLFHWMLNDVHARINHVGRHAT